MAYPVGMQKGKPTCNIQHQQTTFTRPPELICFVIIDSPHEIPSLSHKPKQQASDIPQKVILGCCVCKASDASHKVPSSNQWPVSLDMHYPMVCRSALSKLAVLTTMQSKLTTTQQIAYRHILQYHHRVCGLQTSTTAARCIISQQYRSSIEADCAAIRNVSCYSSASYLPELHNVAIKADTSQ